MFLVLAATIAGGSAAVADLGGGSPPPAPGDGFSGSLPPPSGLTVSATATSLTLSWQPVRYAASYDLYFDGQAAGSTVTTSWAFGNLQCATTHRLEVDARRGHAKSPRAGVTASTSACPTGGPPVNTSPPTVSGTPQEGQALTGATGTWTGTQPISFAFQWYRCDSGGGSCKAISGGTGQNYVLGSLDVGKTVRLTVKASNNVGSASAQSAPTPVVQPASSSTFGTMSPGPNSDNATSDYKETSTYTAPAAGVVTKVTGYLSGLGAGSGSQPVEAVLYADSGGAPGGLLGVSKQVSVPAGQAWGWVDFTFSTPVAIQAGPIWMGYIAGSVNNLTEFRYDSSSSELHYNSNRGGYGSGPSNPFGSPKLASMHYSMYATYTPGAPPPGPPPPPGPQPPANVSPPAVSGAAVQGQTLLTSDGVWSGSTPMTFSYQWERCTTSPPATCTTISGASQSSYVLTAAEVGFTVDSIVTAQNAAGSASAHSAPTAVVTASGGGGGGGSGTANVWVNTVAGSSPSRCSTPCAYDPTHAYGSLASAYAAASAGDLAVVKCGAYGQTSFSSRKTSGPITFQPETDYCATLGQLDFTNGGDYATFRHFAVNDFDGAVYQGGSTVSRNVVLDGNKINVGKRVDTQNVDVHTVNGWRFVNNTIGPSCCGSGGSSPEGIRIGIPSGAPNSTNVTIDNNVIQYVMRSCSYWPSSGWGSCPASSCSSCHMDGIHVWGLTNSVISRNRIYNVEVQGIFLEPTNGSLNSNVSIVNNAVQVMGGNAGIYVKANDSSSTGGTWTIAFNSTPDLIELGAGFSGDQPGTVFNLTGNIANLMITNSSGNDAGCTGYPAGTAINYAYNVWRTDMGGATQGPCGSTDTTGNPAFVNSQQAPAVGIDLHLGSSGPADNFVAAAACTAITSSDMDGQTRPAGSKCDAGADER